MNNSNINTNSNRQTSEVGFLTSKIIELSAMFNAFKARQELQDAKLDRLLASQMLAIEDNEAERRYNLSDEFPLTVYLKEDIKDKIMAKENRLGKRNIGYLRQVSTDDEDTDDNDDLNEPAQPKQRNVHQRLTQLIIRLYKDAHGIDSTANHTQEAIDVLKNPFQRLAKEICYLFINSQKQDIKKWGDLDPEDQRYCCLVFEDAAFKEIPLKGMHRCKKSWASRAYLGLAFKARHQRMCHSEKKKAPSAATHDTAAARSSPVDLDKTPELALSPRSATSFVERTPQLSVTPPPPCDQETTIEEWHEDSEGASSTDHVVAREPSLPPPKTTAKRGRKRRSPRNPPAASRRSTRRIIKSDAEEEEMDD